LRRKKSLACTAENLRGNNYPSPQKFSLPQAQITQLASSTANKATPFERSFNQFSHFFTGKIKKAALTTIASHMALLQK